MKPRTYILVLVMAIALIAAACSDSDTSDTPTTAPAGAAETTTTASSGDETTTTAAAEVPAEDFTLKVWSWLPNDHDNGPATYDEIFANFEAKYPNVTIELTAMPYPTFWDTWRNATIAGTGPDVISMYGGAAAGGYAKSLVPLQDSLSAETTSDLRFIDSSVSPDGNLYALPAGAYAYHLLVNENVLSEAGLTAEIAFGTWESLISSCQTLSAAGVRPFASGWSDGYELEGYMYVLMSQLLDPAGFDAWVTGQLPLTDDRFYEGMNYVVEMNDAGCFPEDSLGKASYYDAFDDIIAGDAAAFRSGDGYTALDAEANNGEGSMVIMPFPQVPGSQYTDMSDSGPNQGWSVTSWAVDTAAATALVEHIVSAESQQLLWDNTQLPPNVSSLSVESESALFNSYLSVIANPVNHTTFMAFTDPALAIFQREASNLIAGRATPEDILPVADEAQQRALQEMFE